MSMLRNSIYEKVGLTLQICLHTVLLWLFSGLFLGCGNNTDVPALAVPLSYPAATTPSIIAVDFMQSSEGDPQFNLEYYVSNEEPDFIGYNLYISTAPSSLRSYLLATQDGLYLPRGIEPSFSHSGEPASNAPADLKTQTISHRTAPPVPEPFYECQVYYFRFAAYLRGGFRSEASDEVQTCASDNPSSCPSGSPCNP